MNMSASYESIRLAVQLWIVSIEDLEPQLSPSPQETHQFRDLIKQILFSIVYLKKTLLQVPKLSLMVKYCGVII